MRARVFISSCLIALTWGSTDAADPAEDVPVLMTESASAETAARVRQEAQHAWNNYWRHARGHDDLKPLSRAPRDWYQAPLLMTPVDALDTLLLLGLDREAEQAQSLIVTRLKFDHDMYVQNFEITIRLLGGLISGYQMTGDRRLLVLAEDLGTRLLPVFESPTGLPYTHVNLRTGQVRGKISGPAETGTLLLEFGALSRLTGRPVFYEKAKRALLETYKRRADTGLVGAAIDVESGRWTDTSAHIGGGIDSYYEYLYKCWRLFRDEECKRMWETSIAAVNRHLAHEIRSGELWYGRADMLTGRRTQTQYGALDAFMAALLAIGGDVPRARSLQESNLRMWRLHGIEPEVLDYGRMEVISPGYALRPEIVESAYYLHRLTGDVRYRLMGRELFEDFVRHCRTDAGYAALEDIRTKRQQDSMESFVLAETFKYFYLLFAPSAVLDFERVTFNTEAHPLQATWPQQ